MHSEAVIEDIRNRNKGLYFDIHTVVSRSTRLGNASFCRMHTICGIVFGLYCRICRRNYFFHTNDLVRTRIKLKLDFGKIAEIALTKATTFAQKRHCLSICLKVVEIASKITLSQCSS